MNRTKAFIACITVSLTGIAVSGCASASEAAGDDCGEHTIKIGHAIATTSPLQVGAEEFQSIIEEETDGRLTVEIFPASQLGSETDMIEQVRSGALDIVLASPAVISNTYPDAAILAMPFVIDGDSEAEQYVSLQTAAASDVVAEMTEEMAAEQGMRPVDWTWWYGNRHITNGVRAIESVDDLAGLKLRTPDAPIHFLALEALGASVTPLAFNELYLALQTGTVDGQENPASTIETTKLYEVQDYLAVTGHMTQAEIALFSESIWQTLCAADQEAITSALQAAGQVQSEIAIAENAAALDRLEEAGMQITVLDQADLRAATEGAAEKWAADNPGFSLERYEAFVAAQS